MEMKMLAFVVLLGLHSAAAVMHSWKAFYTGSTGLTEFPEFVALNLLDDEVMGYFDSRTNRFESKQSWVMENLGQEYVEQQTNILRGNVPTFKGNVAILRERFNQSKGAHIFQYMYGCDWDDQTGDIDGLRQYGYDGEDFLNFDAKTNTWIAPVQQAEITKNRWNDDKALIARRKHYLTQTCVDWLKKYVNYGKSSLMRTALPSVSLLQKTPSSPVSCLATGFYSQGAVMLWRKDGEELHDERGEILPNHDGSFQMSAILDLSSVKPEDWGKYECVLQLPGVKDIITKLDKAVIRSNEKTDMTIIIVAVVVVVALVLIAGIGFMVYKKKKDNKGNALASSETSSEQSERLKPVA